jgi:superfamily II DNA or RNA helicase
MTRKSFLRESVMEIELRNYQTECIRRVLASYEQTPKGGSELLVLPTGAGKTIVFCQVIGELNKQYGLNSLIIAHRDELLDQAADKYRMVKPDAIIGKVGSGLHEYGGEVTVASIATISRPEHIKRLKQIGYGLIIVDEAHHSEADSYQKVLEALPEAFVLGVTATPDRLDKKTLFNGKPALYSASIIDMVRDGYLCDVKAVAIRTETNLDDLHTEMGDYKIGELEAAVDTPERNKRVVDAYLEKADERRALCFGVTVQHAENLTRAFSLQGVPVGMVEGNTPLDERKRLYRALRSGEIKVLCNVLVLTEGFDEPKVDCIIMARPTQSRALYVQCIGRGLRLAPAKENCLILDLTDNCLKHRLEPQNLKKALGKEVKDDETIIEALAREEEEEKERAHRTVVRKLPETRKQDMQIDLLEKLLWQERMDGMFVLEVGPLKHRIALVPCKNEWDTAYYDVWARLYPGFEGQKWLASMPLDWAQQYAEKRARMLLADEKNIKLLDRNAAWRGAPASEKQLELLAKFRVVHQLGITKGEAADLLDPIFERLERRKQKKAMER